MSTYILNTHTHTHTHTHTPCLCVCGRQGQALMRLAQCTEASHTSPQTQALILTVGEHPVSLTHYVERQESRHTRSGSVSWMLRVSLVIACGSRGGIWAPTTCRTDMN